MEHLARVEASARHGFFAQKQFVSDCHSGEPRAAGAQTPSRIQCAWSHRAGNAPHPASGSPLLHPRALWSRGWHMPGARGRAGRQYHPREHAASSALGDWGPAPWGDSPAPGGRGSRRGARGLAVQEGGGGPFALTMGFCWEGPGMDTPLLVFPAFLVTCTYTFPWSLETRQW